MRWGTAFGTRPQDDTRPRPRRRRDRDFRRRAVDAALPQDPQAGQEARPARCEKPPQAPHPRRRRCVTPRSFSPTSSPARRRRGGAQSSFRCSNACRIAWAISTTSWCTRTGLRRSPIAAGKAAAAAGSSKRAFAAGLLTGREDARLDTVVASASNAHAALVKIKPFWC